jgi:hypothetical protein
VLVVAANVSAWVLLLVVIPADNVKEPYIDTTDGNDNVPLNPVNIKSPIPSDEPKVIVSVPAVILMLSWGEPALAAGTVTDLVQ